MDNTVVHFEIPADDVEKLKRFYSDLFGWKIEKSPMPVDYWLIQTGTEEEPGITGGVAGRIKPEDTAAVIFDVKSVDDVSKNVVDAGGVIREDKKAIPGVGYLIMCRDTEGNTFGIMQIDESVK